MIKRFKQSWLEYFWNTIGAVPLKMIITMLPQYRQPTHPGEIIRYEFLEPSNLTQQQLADAIGVTRVRINEIILGKRSVTPATAFRGKVFQYNRGFLDGAPDQL